MATAVLALLPYTIHARSSLADEIIAGLNNAADCASCHSLLVTFRATAALGDDAFVNSLKSLCKRLKVCRKSLNALQSSL